MDAPTRGITISRNLRSVFFPFRVYHAYPHEMLKINDNRSTGEV